jgi:hypothetical protein
LFLKNSGQQPKTFLKKPLFVLIYNVTTKVSTGVHQAWLQWMQQVHIPAVMETGCFLKHQLVHLLDADDEEGVTYAVQYYAANTAQYEAYVSQHASALRQAAFDAWGDAIVAFRSLMQVLD